MLFEFLESVSQQTIEKLNELHFEQLGRNIDFYQDELPLDLATYDVAIVGCCEIRNARNSFFEGTGVNEIKNAFYRLFPGDWNSKIIDLGIINPGDEVKDSYYALGTLSKRCLESKTVLIVLGGGQDLNYPLYRSLDDFDGMVNVVNIDARFDVGNIDAPIDARSHIGKMISELPYNLYNYTNVGYQTYYNSQEEIDLLDTLFFDTVRLGELDHDITLSEPYLRDANLVTVDMQSVSGSYLAFAKANPNGFNGKQICGLSRYAGISDRCNFFSIFEFPLELNESSKQLIAQMMWYFIEGYNYRYNEFPIKVDESFLKYRVAMDKEELVFYNSTSSGRWWVELPFFTGHNNKLKQHTLLACDRKDYDEALKNRIPERWLKARMKNEV